jgi:hypothetical protein
MKPLIVKRDGHRRIIFWFGVSPVEFDTLPEAFNQASRYA